MSDSRETLRDLVAASRIHKIRVLAWRDLEDPEAGGSEIHMDEVCRRWADAGLRIDARTSAVAGQPERVQRHGYFVERKGGRYQVFIQAMWRGLRHDRHEYDALVEIWNGIPFFGPLWFHRSRLTLIHHVHRDMWHMTLSKWLAHIGWFVEHRFAPLFYRFGTIATLSRSSAQEIKDFLKIRDVRVVPVGVSDFFQPGGEKSPVPLVVAVGRLVSVKRFDLLISAFVEVHKVIPTAQFVIVSEGYLRTELERQIADANAREWILLPGRISDEALRELYQRAWVLTSNSLREGWGMTITEAAACATPCVVTDIAGHRDAVIANKSGILVGEHESLASALSILLNSPDELTRLSAGALKFARTLTWDAVALQLFELLDERDQLRH